jgi:hypothetical protein
MESKTPLETLKAHILLLEIRQATERQELSELFKNLQECLRPVNIVRHTLNEFLLSHDIKQTLVQTGLTVAVGYFSKKISTFFK